MANAPTADPNRRSIFLVAVVFAANAYLLVYGADGTLSVLDSLLKQLTGSNALDGLRATVADLEFLFSLVMIFVLAFTPHLPKRVYLPPLIYLVLDDLGAFSALGDGGWADVALLAVQVLFFLLAISLIERTTGHWLLKPEMLPRKQHLLRHTIIALVVMVLVLPITLAGLAVAGIAAAVESETGGYLHFGLSGVDVAESTLMKDGKTVRLVGMMHIGEPQFYRSLYESFPAGALVLAEGVTDDQHKLVGGLSYKRAATAIGLEQQPQVQQLLSEQEAGSGADAKPAGQPTVIRADVDVSDFSPRTITFLTWVADIYASNSFSEAVTKMSGESSKFSEDDIKTVMADIVDKRNAKVLMEFDENAGTYKTIIIPWGAEHMKGIEAGMRMRGYILQAHTTHRVLDYGTLIEKLMHPA